MHSHAASPQICSLPPPPKREGANSKFANKIFSATANQLSLRYALLPLHQVCYRICFPPQKKIPYLIPLMRLAMCLLSSVSLVTCVIMSIANLIRCNSCRESGMWRSSTSVGEKLYLYLFDNTWKLCAFVQSLQFSVIVLLYYLSYFYVYLVHFCQYKSVIWSFLVMKQETGISR